MLRNTDRYVPMVQAGQAELNADAEGIQKRIANAKEKWAGYSAAERAELSLEPADGVGPAIQQVQPQPQVAPQQLAPTGAPPPAMAPAPMQPASQPAAPAPVPGA